MTQPSGNDYGTHNDSVLVPNSLTAYRHFVLELPGSFRTDEHSNIERNRAPRLTPVNQPAYMGAYDNPVPGEPFKAKCNRIESSWLYDFYVPPPQHEAPNVECRCGFYAHYKPTTDFYDDMIWVSPDESVTTRMPQVYELLYYTFMAQHDTNALRRATRSIGRVDSSLESRGSALGAPDMLTPGRVVVRAVVEMTGATVAGTLGVRGQRMQIKALAVDWEKFVGVQHMRERVRRARESGSPTQVFSRIEEFNRDGLFLTAIPTDYEREETEGVAKVAATMHGATFYESVDQMYADHPPADLEALGIDTTAKPSGVDPLHAGLKGLKAAMRASVAAFGNFKAIYPDATSVQFDAPLPPGGKVAMPDNWRAALDAKRNRQAPPGTGIDRRKKKL